MQLRSLLINCFIWVVSIFCIKLTWLIQFTDDAAGYLSNLESQLTEQYIPYLIIKYVLQADILLVAHNFSHPYTIGLGKMQHFITCKIYTLNSMIQHVNDSTCNTCRYFTGCTVFLHALKGQGKIQAMRKMFACIMLNNQIKDILLLISLFSILILVAKYILWLHLCIVSIT